MASIRKRGELQWEARVRRRGQPIQCKTFTTKARAETWVRQVEGEMDRGVFVSRAEAENTTLAEALARYAQEVTPRKKATTANRERDRIRAWAASSLSQRSLASIRGKDVAAAIRDMEGRGLSANTVRLHLALLSHLFNTARAAWGMESLTNPVDLVKGQRPKPPTVVTGACRVARRRGCWRPPGTTVMPPRPRVEPRILRVSSPGPSRPRRAAAR